MSGLHLVRLPLDGRALTAFAIAERADDDDYGYAAHLALRRRFGPAAPQPFRLSEDSPAGAHLLGYTGDPGALAEAAALPATDAGLDAVFPVAPAIRPMPDSWRIGARYGFEVRIRPIVRYGGRVRERRADDASAWQRRAGEVDAFVAACEKAPGASLDRAAVYCDWLIAQTAGIVEIARADPRLVRRLVTRRSSHGKPGARRIEGYEAVLAGELNVADPDRFAHLLARGIGRHTAFGFGMLLLAPLGRLGRS